AVNARTSEVNDDFQGTGRAAADVETFFENVVPAETGRIHKSVRRASNDRDLIAALPHAWEDKSAVRLDRGSVDAEQLRNLGLQDHTQLRKRNIYLALNNHHAPRQVHTRGNDEIEAFDVAAGNIDGLAGGLAVALINRDRGQQVCSGSYIFQLEISLRIVYAGGAVARKREGGRAVFLAREKDGGALARLSR